LLSDSLPFHGVDRSSAVEAVRTQLEEAIRDGQVEVGSRLPSEHELARTMGVSRPVLREALGHLRGLGLIVSKNGKGSFVASSTHRPLLLGRYSTKELHEIRILLEVEGASLAAQRRRASDLKRLKKAVDELAGCTDHEQWVELDAAFHVALAEATGNNLQAHLVRTLRDLLIEYSLVVAAVEGRMKSATDEHRAIYEAIRDGDPVAAQRAMSNHLLNAYTT
jgi:GntR family transcriptional repressor for pyruvate dehydrogenase complex